MLFCGLCEKSVKRLNSGFAKKLPVLFSYSQGSEVLPAPDEAWQDEMLEWARPHEEVVRDLFAWPGPGAWFAAHSGEFQAAFLFADERTTQGQ